jgi:hypothetical protein
MKDESLDDQIEAWHNGAGENQELYTFLGMTLEEYQLWL